jgi:hypothetical protein
LNDASSHHTAAPEVAVGPRVGAEEPHVRADPAQRRQRLAHPRVGDVPLAVDREAVAPEPGAGRPRLDPGEVDAAYRELGEQLEQRARVVVGDERHDVVRSAPVGGGGAAGATEDEARHRAVVVVMSRPAT